MNEVKTEAPILVTFKEYLRLQQEIILGEENWNAAKKHYGREITRNDAACYFVTSGGAAEFSKKYKIINSLSANN